MRQHKRNKRKRKSISPEERREIERVRASAPPGFLIVYPFVDWCRLRGISKRSGQRLVQTGRVKVTQLSERRIGIRADHDREFLDSCLRAGA